MRTVSEVAARRAATKLRERCRLSGWQRHEAHCFGEFALSRVVRQESFALQDLRGSDVHDIERSSSEIDGVRRGK